MSIFKKSLEYLFGKDQMKEYPNQKIEVVVTQPEINCINNKIIYNVSNQTVIVITCDGDKFEGSNVQKEQIERLRTSTKEEVINILTPTVCTGIKEIDAKEEELVSKFLGIFNNSEDFQVVNNQVYFKSIKNINIPNIIVARFIELLQNVGYNNSEILQEQYNSLKMFTLKLLLNPLEESRNDALTYVKQFNIKMTNTGNLIMFRRIVSVTNSNKDLIEFISKSYLKVKAQKKSPKNYWVHCDMDNGTPYKYTINTNTFSEFNDLGNLADLYSDLPELQENRYTDDYTKSYDIRIGSTYKINEEDIDVNKRGSCGGSLHLADGKVFSYSSFGDTPVVCLVNPMHIYKMDSGHSGKIGVKQMFIAAVTTQDEQGNYEDIDDQELVNFDELYHNETLEELETSLKEKSLSKVSVAELVTELSIPEVKNITELLKNRVVTV